MDSYTVNLAIDSSFKIDRSSIMICLPAFLLFFLYGDCRPCLCSVFYSLSTPVCFPPALMCLILCASYLCILSQLSVSYLAFFLFFFVPLRSCQDSLISRGDVKEVWGASKSAGLRDKLLSLCPQLLSLIKTSGLHGERSKRAAREAREAGRQK